MLVLLKMEQVAKKCNPHRFGHCNYYRYYPRKLQMRPDQLRQCKLPKHRQCRFECLVCRPQLRIRKEGFAHQCKCTLRQLVRCNYHQLHFRIFQKQPECPGYRPEHTAHYCMFEKLFFGKRLFRMFAAGMGHLNMEGGLALASELEWALELGLV